MANSTYPRKYAINILKCLTFQLAKLRCVEDFRTDIYVIPHNLLFESKITIKKKNKNPTPPQKGIRFKWLDWIKSKNKIRSQSLQLLYE